MASEAAHGSASAWEETGPPSRPVFVADSIPRRADGGVEDHTVIDCDRCTMRGIGCGDCVMTVLLGAPPFGVELDEVERRALGVLADAGLVPPLRMVADPEAPDSPSRPHHATPRHPW